MRVIHSAVLFRNGAWFSPRYIPSVYLGCIKNCVKVLADHVVDEIVIFDVGTSNDKALLYDLPKFVNVPISLCGGVNSAQEARTAIAAGYDRVGVNITNSAGNIYLLNEVVDSVGGSSCFGFAVLDDVDSVFDLKQKISGLPHDLSEVLVSSRSRAGSRAGLDAEIIDIAKSFPEKNIAGNGGAKVDHFKNYAKELSAVAISTEWMFQGMSSDSKNFIIQGKYYGM